MPTTRPDTWRTSVDEQPLEAETGHRWRQLLADYADHAARLGTDASLRAPTILVTIDEWAHRPAHCGSAPRTRPRPRNSPEPGKSQPPPPSYSAPGARPSPFCSARR